MYCGGVGTLWVKVIAFQSSLEGDIRPSQTKQALHHYPRKAGQQNITFQCVCRDKYELSTLQRFVRAHQKYALTSPRKPEVMLWWPERGIRDWSGIIRKIEAGDKRFNSVPKVSFTVDLVDSLLSEKTWWSSVAEDFSKFFEDTLQPPGDWKQPLPSLPPVLPDFPQPAPEWGGGGAGGTF